MRLDIASLAYQGGESGAPAISPGDSAASQMIQRITSTDPDSVMPPPDANKAISVAQSDLLRKWIDQGAKYESHWAFTPPVKKPLPIDTKNPIDAFVRHRLGQIGLSNANRASDETLVRRLYLDVVGIPPLPTEATASEQLPIESQIDELDRKSVV